MTDVPSSPRGPFPTCDLLGMSLAQTDRKSLLDYIFGRLAGGHGGWLVTANLDFLRRHAREPEARELYAAADLRVADGFPLVWAARLQGDRLPERITGADLVWLVAERAALDGRSIFLLGGDADSASRAIKVLQGRWPALKVVGSASPTVDRVPTPAQVAALREEIVSPPEIMLVAMGSPKQENLIQALRSALPATWMIGVGATFSFVAGDIRRAPQIIQRMNLEWFWRLSHEPRRLFKRYIIEDLPFAFELFAGAVARGLRRRLRSKTS
jgi:N-acetylglucosaminyldiphosphoundecaprenol N-acetyl-beta-D-mannosaminyltransferase